MISSKLLMLIPFDTHSNSFPEEEMWRIMTHLFLMKGLLLLFTV